MAASRFTIVSGSMDLLLISRMLGGRLVALITVRIFEYVYSPQDIRVKFGCSISMSFISMLGKLFIITSRMSIYIEWTFLYKSHRGMDAPNVLWVPGSSPLSRRIVMVELNIVTSSL